MKHQNQSLRNLLLAAMFLAIGLVLPFFTGQIKEIGNMLLPMHLPVFLCALICGWQYGTAVGFIMPLLRFALFPCPACLLLWPWPLRWRRMRLQQVFFIVGRAGSAPACCIAPLSSP